jgi:hypothetical protein
MKHSIIKDFSGWQRLFEADAAGNPPAATPDPTNANYVPPASAGKTLPAVTVTAPAKSAATAPAAGAGGIDPNVVLPTAPIKSADGRINRNDSIAIQTILMKGGYLTPTFISDKTKQEKKSNDGVIGKRSITAITNFRTKHGITDTAPPTATRAGVTVGANTLAKFNEIIADPTKLVPAQELAEKPAEPTEELQMGQEELAKLEAEKKAKDAAEKAAAEAAIQAATDKGNETVKQIMKLITDQFNNKEFFDEFERGLFRKDNVSGAVVKFTEWFNTTISPMVNSLPDTDKNKAQFGANGAVLLGNLTAGITNKTNRLQVPYLDPAGNPAQIVVNADF